MTVKEYYTDACCRHQYNIFSWAVVTPHHQYCGVVHRNNLHTFFSELFAVGRALMIAKKDDGDVIIYCDNQGVVNWLNKEEDEFLMQFGNSRESELLCRTYYFYKFCPNVRIRKISRNLNRIADSVARRTLRDAEEW